MTHARLEVCLIGDDAGAQRTLAGLGDAVRRRASPATLSDRGVVVMVDEDVDAITETAEGGRPVLVLAQVLDRRHCTRLLRAGTGGIIPAAAGPEVVLSAITVLACGFTLIPNALRTTVVRPVLTPREKQIMSLVVLGATNREVASRLFIAESTVKMHMTNVLAKFEVRSRREAVDLILNPHLGLGTGILTISPDDVVQVGYGPGPVITDGRQP